MRMKKRKHISRMAQGKYLTATEIGRRQIVFAKQWEDIVRKHFEWLSETMDSVFAEVFKRTVDENYRGS